MAEADMLCDRISIVDYGKIVARYAVKSEKVITGADTSVIELDVPNITPTLVSDIQSLSCTQTVTVEDETHIKVHASGDESCDNVIDAVRSGAGRFVPFVTLSQHWKTCSSILRARGEAQVAIR